MKEDKKKEILLFLGKALGVKNPMALPRLSKIVINMGIKDAINDKKKVETGIDILTLIAGQKAKVTKAKKSIATFKLREGDKIGASVTLRGKRMYDFFEKIVTIVLPRLRDFHGVRRTSFDGKGNYTLGFSENAVFPEIDAGNIDPTVLRQGIEICIVTTAKDDKEGTLLLEVLGMPFQKEVISQ